jgi:hypothetical protein
VRAARAAAQHRHTKDFEIPGFEGTIWGTFRALDKWSDVRGIVDRHSHLDGAEQQVNVAAETLLKSCVTLYGVDGTQRAPLNMGLGVQFAEYVEEGSTASPDGIPMTDLQAVFVAIPNEVQLVMLYTALESWYEGVGVKTDAVQVGNSAAPS